MMPKCSGPAAWTLGWMEPEGLATEVGRRCRRAGRGEETSHNPQDSPDGCEKRFLSQGKLHTRGHSTPVRHTICAICSARQSDCHPGGDIPWRSQPTTTRSLDVASRGSSTSTTCCHP